MRAATDYVMTVLSNFHKLTPIPSTLSAADDCEFSIAHLFSSKTEADEIYQSNSTSTKSKRRFTNKD